MICIGRGAGKKVLEQIGIFKGEKDGQTWNNSSNKYYIVEKKKEFPLLVVKIMYQT